MTTWGKDIWEKKSLNQKGIVIAGGVTRLLLGEKSYLRHLRQIREETNEFLSVHPEIKTVLEVGPGKDAVNSKFLLSKNYDLDLVDVSPNTIESAKKKLQDKKVGFYVQDIIDLNLNKKYDLIFCVGTFLHIPQHLALIVMTNFNRHLKKGKYLIVDFPIKNKMTLKKGLWLGFYSLAHRIKTKITGKDFYVTCGEYTIEEIKDILKRTSFKVVSVSKKGYWVIQKI